MTGMTEDQFASHIETLGLTEAQINTLYTLRHTKWGVRSGKNGDLFGCRRNVVRALADRGLVSFGEVSTPVSGGYTRKTWSASIKKHLAAV